MLFSYVKKNTRRGFCLILKDRANYFSLDIPQFLTTVNSPSQVESLFIWSCNGLSHKFAEGYPISKKLFCKILCRIRTILFYFFFICTCKGLNNSEILNKRLIQFYS